MSKYRQVRFFRRLLYFEVIFLDHHDWVSNLITSFLLTAHYSFLIATLLNKLKQLELKNWIRPSRIESGFWLELDCINQITSTIQIQIFIIVDSTNWYKLIISIKSSKIANNSLIPWKWPLFDNNWPILTYKMIQIVETNQIPVIRRQKLIENQFLIQKVIFDLITDAYC